MTSLQISRRFAFAPAPASKRGGVNKLNGWKTACSIFLLCAATATAASAQTFTTLTTFNGTNGGNPGSLVQATDGNFYATATYGGAYGDGTVFKITPAGGLSTLYSFCALASCADGWFPSGLVQATDGDFYGTVYGGGAHNAGTFFRMTLAGALVTLHNFSFTSGCNPEAGVVQATDGNFYGTAVGCGSNGDGTVFKITPAGRFNTLYNFLVWDGDRPVAALVQAIDGNLYGTTAVGAYDGTVFKISPAGKLTNLYSFCATGGSNCPDGNEPQAALVQATDRNFYGTTWGGGVNGYGTVFKISAGGKLTTLHSFYGTDGSYPTAALVQATDGNFYGTTYAGGVNSNSVCDQNLSGCGTIFKITAEGKLTTLYSFCALESCADGFNPSAALIQGTDGNLYGTTSSGQSYGNGTIFRLSVGLHPFVRLISNSGKVAQTAQILGQGFTGTTSVSFRGTPAAFTVQSDTYLTATVPAGATTGFVTVAISGGTLKSNKIFRVTPQILSFSPTGGPVGTTVVITGESFTGANAVVFERNQTPATFSVDSDTQITAIVPPGATGGKIGVRTPGGTVLSALDFNVTP